MAEAGCSDGALFKKRVIKNRGGRKRKNSSSEKDSAESDQDGPTVVVPSRRHKKENPNIQSTGNRNKAHTRKDSDNSSEEGEQFGVTYRSKGVELTHGDQNATATYEFDTEKDRDAQAIFEKALAVNQELEGQADDKIYRGINNYAMYYKKRDTAAGNASSGLVRQGPIRAPANLRATVLWDYQPDICKDYKETGFCGFGDSCKFLHDRGDYKHGWQLERQEAAGGGGADDNDDDTRYEVDSDEEHLPFKCFICRNSFKQPVVTKCKHYFCESCALTNFKKSTRCFICNAQTGGVFNPAKELEARIQAQGAGPPSGDDDNDSD